MDSAEGMSLPARHTVWNEKQRLSVSLVAMRRNIARVLYNKPKPKKLLATGKLHESLWVAAHKLYWVYKQ